MGLVTVKAASPLSDVVAALDEHGVVVVEDLLDPGLLRRFNKELDPLLEGAGWGPQRFVNPGVTWFFGDRVRHVAGVAAKSPIFAREVLVHPVFVAVCDALLLPQCARYQLNLANVLDRGPGSTPQLPHRDEDVWVHLPRPHPEVEVASVIALVDFSAENGATRVVPGSHRWARGRRPREHELVAAEMTAGSAVLYRGSTVHAGGANTTKSHWRRGLHLSYVVGWLRSEENHYLACPPSVARTLPRQSQELLGYAVHDAIEQLGGYLGAVELRDPIELLSEGVL